MKTCSRRLLAKSAGLVFGAVTLLLGASQANATSTLNITYFTISPHDPSYNAMGLSTISDEVLGQLGPDGLPLYNPSNSLPNPISSADLHSTPAGQEITWWSPSLNSNVKQSGIGTVSLPFDHSHNFFPPTGNGADDSAGGLAAILRGTLTAPTAEYISFNIGADDSAFLYLDGQNVCDLGGVHGLAAGTCNTAQVIGKGPHDLQIFFVDLNETQSGLYVNVTTEGIQTSATPEPTTWALLLLGFGLTGTTLRRRRNLFAAAC